MAFTKEYDSVWKQNFPNKQYVLDRAAVINLAQYQDLLVVDADACTLQIDLDKAEDFHRIFLNRFNHLLEWHEVRAAFWTESKSGNGNRHVHIILRNPIDSPFARIALQSYLGSDPVREFLSTQRALAGMEHPTLLLEKRNAVQHMIYATAEYTATFNKED